MGLAEAERLSLLIRDDKLVLRASWLSKASGRAGVALIAVIHWMCFRTATFKSSSSMIAHLYSKFLREQGRRVYRDCGSGRGFECSSLQV